MLDRIIDHKRKGEIWRSNP